MAHNPKPVPDDHNDQFSRQTFDELHEAMGPHMAGIIEKYLQNGDKQVDAMIQAEKHQDYDTIARAAHTLKSTSATLGLVKMHDLSVKIEDAANNGDAQKIGSYLSDIKDAYAQATEILSSHNPG